ARRRLPSSSRLAPCGRDLYRSSMRLFAVAAVATAALAVAASAGAQLRTGAHGPRVRALELQLAWHGFPSGAIDGRFGPHVAVAVRRFQRSVGLRPDGVAGPATLRALGRPAPRLPIPLAWPLLGSVGDRFRPRAN